MQNVPYLLLKLLKVEHTKNIAVCVVSTLCQVQFIILVREGEMLV